MFSYVVRQALYVFTLFMCAIVGDASSDRRHPSMRMTSPNREIALMSDDREGRVPKCGTVLVYLLTRVTGDSHMTLSVAWAYRSFPFPHDSMVIRPVLVYLR